MVAEGGTDGSSGQTLLTWISNELVRIQKEAHGKGHEQAGWIQQRRRPSAEHPEGRPFAAATISRRIACASGFYESGGLWEAPRCTATLTTSSSSTSSRSSSSVCSAGTAMWKAAGLYAGDQRRNLAFGGFGNGVRIARAVGARTAG